MPRARGDARGRCQGKAVGGGKGRGLCRMEEALWITEGTTRKWSQLCDFPQTSAPEEPVEPQEL